MFISISFYKDNNLKLSEDSSTKSIRMAVIKSTDIREKIKTLTAQVAFYCRSTCQYRNVGTVKNRQDEQIITNGRDSSVIRLRLNSSLFSLIFLPVLLK